MRHSFFLLLISFLFTAQALEAIQLADRLKLTGYLRNRYWNFYSETPSPTSTFNQNYLSYLDLFSSNRLQLLISKKISVQALFSIFTIYGQTSGGSVETVGGGLAKPGFNLITRNLFMEAKLWDSLRIQLGLLPFSLANGHILAKDGAGLKIDYSPEIPYLNPYFYWIKAVENSLTSSEKNGIEPQQLRDDDILILGNDTEFFSWLRGNVYYVFRYDLNLLDSVSGSLHWFGLETQSLWKDYQIELSFIYNHGSLEISSKKVSVSAFLWGIYLGYNISGFSFGLRNEGASGDNLREPYTHNTFQNIGVSRGLSRIVIDDSGGLSMRRGGNLSGINSTSIEALWKYSANLELTLKTFYFLLLRDIESSLEGASKSRNLGPEINFSITYRLFGYLELMNTTSVFFPQEAYFNWVNSPSPPKRTAAILEILFSAKVSY